MPATPRLLTRLLPSTLPITRSVWPRRADWIPITISGSEVPIATSESPMKASERPTEVATSAAESTSSRAATIVAASVAAATASSKPSEFLTAPGSPSGSSAGLSTMKTIGRATSNSTPSIRLIPPISARLTARTAAIESEASRRSTDSCTTSGVISAATPSARPTLTVFEPTKLPTARPSSPSAAAKAETSQSGRLVPTPIRTTPMNSGLAPSKVATDAAETTNRSAARARVARVAAMIRRSASMVGPGARSASLRRVAVQGCNHPAR